MCPNSSADDGRLQDISPHDGDDWLLAYARQAFEADLRLERPDIDGGDLPPSESWLRGYGTKALIDALHRDAGLK